MENNILDGPVMPAEGAAYRDSTYELVSKVAYLLGVPKRIFDNEHEPPKLEVYERLEKDKNARITAADEDRPPIGIEPLIRARIPKATSYFLLRDSTQPLK